MSSKQQTAVEWLQEQLKENMLTTAKELDELFKQAKAMEKEQILSAFDSGEACWYDDFSEYYTSTYE